MTIPKRVLFSRLGSHLHKYIYHNILRLLPVLAIGTTGIQITNASPSNPIPTVYTSFQQDLNNYPSLDLSHYTDQKSINLGEIFPTMSLERFANFPKLKSAIEALEKKHQIKKIIDNIRPGKYRILKLQNSSNETRSIFLKMGFSHWKRVYLWDGVDWNTHQTGAVAEKRHRPNQFIISNIPVTIPKNATAIIVIHGNSLGSISIEAGTTFFEDERQQFALILIYLGVIACLIIYNTFLGFSLGEPVYFIYAGMSFGWQINVTSYFNNLYHHIFGEYATLAVNVFTLFIAICAPLFIVGFCDAKKSYPKISNGILYSGIFSAIGTFLGVLAIVNVIPASTFDPLFKLRYLGFLSLIIFAIVLFANGNYSKKNHTIKLLSFCMLPLLIASLVFIAGILTKKLDNFWLRNSMAIGGLIEGLLLSFALASKHKRMKDLMLKAERKTKQRFASIITLNRSISIDFSILESIESYFPAIIKEVPTLADTRTYYISSKLKYPLKIDVSGTKEARDLSDSLQSKVCELSEPGFCSLKKGLAYNLKKRSNSHGYIFFEGLDRESLKDDEFAFMDVALISLVANLESVSYLRDETEKTRLETEMRAARTIQESLLSTSKEVPNLDVSYYYKTAEQAGGDWFGNYFDPHQKIYFVFCGDVTGHGLSASLMTGVAAGLIEGFMDDYFQKSKAGLIYDPVDVIQTIINRANNAIRNTGTGLGKVMTMCALAIDTRSGEVWYGNAGHEHPLHLSKEKVRSVVNSGTILGTGETDQFEFKVKRFQLTHGDSVVCYTDGLSENYGPRGQVLPQRFLRKGLIKNYEYESKALLNSIIEEGQKHWQDHPAQDDCTVIIYRWLNPSAENAQLAS